MKPDRPGRRFPAMTALVAVICLAPLAGCAAYKLGPASLYRSNIRTVHVPVVRNDTFRHDLGVRLTEALVRAVERRSFYKVTDDPNADSTLRCRIVGESKRVLTETGTDDPRALDAAITVRGDWVSRNGEVLMHNAIATSDDLTISFGQNSRFVPEAGQSIDSASQATLEALAERIVSQMEVRW
ncbi:MAG: LPS assembly lipoprotein LptE [Pirellulales bacterium]|nr:LPS assembly lipoprotein LptE [Pirellulales bacterium]